MKPQPYLTETGKKIFAEILKELDGTVMEIDTYELSMLAQAYAEYQDFSEQLQSITLTLVDRGRLVAMRDKVWKQTTKQNHEYGMTPIGRDKLTKLTKKEPAKTDPLEKYGT